jgi:hypothetical protein
LETAKTGVRAWTQEKLASAVLLQEIGWQPPVDCSNDPNALCDRPASLDDALGITMNLAHNGARYNGVLDFPSIKCWIDQKLPIGARIAWYQGGAHFVTLSGYQEFQDGSQLVLIDDPLHQEGLWDYNALRTQYGYDVGRGSWHDTYLTVE